MNTDFLEKLKSFDIPTCLRVCAGTDGSVTFLLEIMTKHEVAVVTEDQHIIKPDGRIVSLLGIDVGDDVNCRTVTLAADGIPYVYARSMSPIGRMPDAVRQDMMRADIPIGKILRDHGIETRRDFDKIDIVNGKGLFGCSTVLSRSYNIIHKNSVLMRINEQFPVDSRWNL